MPYNNAMNRLLPIGIQDFADIRERGFCYVDETALVHRLISGSGKPFFLSRPRRFGKSLLCSTLNNALGNVADDYGLKLRGEHVNQQFVNLYKESGSVSSTL